MCGQAAPAILPVAVPVVREKPTNGTVAMLIAVTEVAASGNCSARKVPAVALIYSPRDDSAGTDSVGIEIEAGNRTTFADLSYLGDSARQTP